MSAKPVRGQLVFNWLWLTDLHFGQGEQQWLWPTCREEFLEDLGRLHGRCGPWDAIVFSGDLVYSGKCKEFAELSGALRRVMDKIGQLQDYAPTFLAVPGNHDISRPAKSPTMIALNHWWEHKDVRDEFWNDPSSEYRRTVVEAHSAFSEWMGSNGLARPGEYRSGTLPGDFSAVIEKDGARLGVVGLNSTFLQVAGGNYEGKLDLHPRQLVEACGGDQADWLAGNHASLLLTHQPPSWLHPDSRGLYEGIIYPTRSFVAHFYGHMHDSAATAASLGSAGPRRQFQGCSLYGLERFGEAFERQRFKFGYASVQIKIDGDRGWLTLWPRSAVVKQSRDLRLGPDLGYELVDGSNHTPPVEFPLKLGRDGRTSVRVRVGEGRAPSDCDCPDSRTARFILQLCPDGLPREVLAGALQVRTEQMASLLDGFLDESALGDHDEFKLAEGPGALVLVTGAEDSIGRCLELLLAYIENHKKDARVARFVDSAISLARRCRDAKPTVVSGLFNKVDRILKRRGDKRKVLEAATITIESTRHPYRTDEDVRREAKALICGRSWVLQRIGRLEEAMADAKKSLALGEKLNWDRNTAFCNKCIGRIYRRQAEQETDPNKKRDLINRSIESLKAAVTIFKRISDIGPDDPEVGDCYSLAARTYLVAGGLREARLYLTKAADRLHDQTDKDYLDYLILEGDLAAVNGDHNGWDSYDRVIRSSDTADCEKSEIRARALFRRGESWVSSGRPDLAATDFDAAARIWESLSDRKSASAARWREIVVEGKLSKQSMSSLANEEDSVKVIGFHLHEMHLAAHAIKGPRRSEPDKRYWQFIVRQAREQDAKEDTDW